MKLNNTKCVRTYEDDIVFSTNSQSKNKDTISSLCTSKKASPSKAAKRTYIAIPDSGNNQNYQPIVKRS